MYREMICIRYEWRWIIDYAADLLYHTISVMQHFPVKILAWIWLRLLSCNCLACHRFLLYLDHQKVKTFNTSLFGYHEQNPFLCLTFFEAFPFNSILLTFYSSFTWSLYDLLLTHVDNCCHVLPPTNEIKGG